MRVENTPSKRNHSRRWQDSKLMTRNFSLTLVIVLAPFVSLIVTEAQGNSSTSDDSSTSKESCVIGKSACVSNESFRMPHWLGSYSTSSVTHCTHFSIMHAPVVQYFQTKTIFLPQVNLTFSLHRNPTRFSHYEWFICDILQWLSSPSFVRFRSLFFMAF